MMDIDYVLIILPSILLLGIFGFILIIWQYGHFRRTTEKSAPVLPGTTQQASIERVENLIILQLLATEERPYRGYELIQTLSSAGFHYGAMNIFHYYADHDKKQERLFSLASAIEPGTFDLAQIGTILAPGLCLFMPLHPQKNRLDTFELMLETAQMLIQDLGGTLCDGQRQPITPHALLHYRSRLHLYA